MRGPVLSALAWQGIQLTLGLVLLRNRDELLEVMALMAAASAVNPLLDHRMFDYWCYERVHDCRGSNASKTLWQHDRSKAWLAAVARP